MSQRKILVIEDVHYLRNDVLEMLRYEGYDVAGAENGIEGIKVVQEFMPDLIVCDIMMPGLDGYEVLEKLRADSATRTIPFIFLTAKTDRPDVRRGMALGANDYITKPFYSNELLDTIKARLAEHDEYERITTKKVSQVTESIATSLPHELRTPLNTVIGFSDMLIAEHATIQPQQILDWAQFINNAGIRLYRLVENYLAYVRVEATLRTPAYIHKSREKRTVRPNEVIEFQALNTAQMHKRIENIKLSLDASCTIAIAEEDLTTLVSELVDNACKFSKDEGGEVLIKTCQEDDQFILTITDHGRGMKAEDIANIGAYIQFERFFYEQQGIGLGLTICKRLTEIYNGKLQVISEHGAGTTVKVSLPVAP